jgi:hypothetical protein
VVLLLILIMNELNNCSMFLMIMCGGVKITASEESADFATLDTEKLFSKLKSHELSRKGCPNYDASFTSNALITSGRVGGHDANPTNTISSSLEFALSSLAVASDEQYESTVVSEKMIEDDLNHVEESATKSTHKLGVRFKRCEDKGEKSAPKFVPSSNYHKAEETL